MKGMPRSPAISLRVSAVSSAICFDSTTQGPAIRNRGRPGRPGSRKASCCHRGLGLARLVLEGSFDEGREKPVSRARRRGEFGVELATDEPRMRGQLDHLAQLLALGDAGDAQPLVLQSLDV